MLFALMVMPRSRSRSIESSTCSCISRCVSAPVISSKRSASVDLPWSNKRSEEHTSELQSHVNIVCRLLLEKKNNPDEAVPSFVSGAMAKAGKGLLEGTLQAGTSAVSDKLLDLVGLGGKSAADKGKDTRDYLAAAFPDFFV